MGYDGVLDPKKMSVPVSILKKGYHMDASKVLWTLKYINEYEKNKPRRMQTEMDLIKLVTSYYLQAKFFWATCEELDQSSTQEKIDESLDHPVHQIVINRSDLEKARIADEEKRALREHRVIPEDYDGEIDKLDFDAFIWDADYDKEFLKQRKKLWEAERAKEEEESYFTDEILPEDLNEEDLLLYKGETDSWQVK